MSKNLFYDKLTQDCESIDPFNPNEWCEKIVRSVNETEDAFIFSTIKPFIDSITTIEISKEELVMAIALIRKQKEAIEKYGVTISDNWDTAVRQSIVLEKAYKAGFQDGMEEYHERLEKERMDMLNNMVGELR